MSTENKETSQIKEGFSKGEDHDDLDEQKLETVVGGADRQLMQRYLKDQGNLVKRLVQSRPTLPTLARRLTGYAYRPELRRTRSAHGVPNVSEYIRTRQER